MEIVQFLGNAGISLSPSISFVASLFFRLKDNAAAIPAFSREGYLSSRDHNCAIIYT